MNPIQNAKSWNNFFENEKLIIKKLEDSDRTKLSFLIMEAAQICKPNRQIYAKRLETRDFICKLAMSMGIDLLAIKIRNKVAMGRGLLDAWMKAYAEEYGSATYTSTEQEQKRRDIRTKLAKRFP